MYNNQVTRRCDGMVDVVDSKSTAGNSVPVRVRPPVPKKVMYVDLNPYMTFLVCSDKIKSKYLFNRGIQIDITRASRQAFDMKIWTNLIYV